MAIYRALGHLREEYRAKLDPSDLAMISRRARNGDIIRTVEDDSILSYVQDLESLIRNREIQTRRNSKVHRRLLFRELELEEKARADFLEHEEEVKDFMDRIEDRDKYIATLEEKMDLGEDLFPSGDDGPLGKNPARQAPGQQTRSPRPQPTSTEAAAQRHGLQPSAPHAPTLIIPELVRPSPELQLTRALSPSSRSSLPSPSSTKAAPDFPKLRCIAPTPSPSSPTIGAAAPPSPESPPSSSSVAAVRCKLELPSTVRSRMYAVD
nr:sulfated surface glycoprotein 185-like [Aegilops tauschii subsp. strangulata]